MGSIGKLYGQSLALLSDLYEFTMAYGYWKVGVAEHPAVFNAFFRSCPFEGGYAVFCGLDNVIDYLENLHFTDEDLDYLAALKGNDDKPLFDAGFLEYLRTFEFACDVDAMPEGTLVFPHEPMIRVRGPIVQAQFLETTLLNLINYETLIATKASRVVRAAGDGVVLEFGLRRAPGPDGGVSEARATMVGGCDATSNVLAGKLFDVPVKGTHAHSWVMAHSTELESFENWAVAMPNNGIFLVDTYDSIAGVKRAIRVGKKLRERGHRMVGVRLDSGDLAKLSIESRKILDEAGFEDAKIVASGDLDEYAITDLNERGAKIDIYGVGTKMATAGDDPALGGVYKITAVADETGEWHYKIKLSEEREKTSNPGIQQVRRFYRKGKLVGDIIWNEPSGIGDEPVGHTIKDSGSKVDVSEADSHEDVLVPIFRAGKRVYEPVSVSEVARRTRKQLETLPEAYKRIREPAEYPVGLEEKLWEIKQRLMEELEGQTTKLQSRPDQRRQR